MSRDKLWDGGKLILPRALFRSALWRRLTPEQRSVVMAMWVLANYTDSGFAYGPERVDVERGELAHSLDTIAQEAGVSI